MAQGDSARAPRDRALIGRSFDGDYTIVPNKGTPIPSPRGQKTGVTVPDVCQIVNTSDDVLTYIALSDRKVADVILYPDSGKFGVWHGDWRNPDAPDNFLYFGRREQGLDYWDGEDAGDVD